MKFLIVIVCFGVAVFATNSKNLKLREYAELSKHINSAQLSWKASNDHEMAAEIETLFTLHGECTHEKPSKLKIKKYSEEEYASLPKEFDSRKKWPKCKSIGHIRDQSACGSCWAFGTVEAMTDRICTKSNGKKNPILSSAHLTACDKSDKGCQGGQLVTAYDYYQDPGLVTGGDYNSKIGCWPYPFKQCEHHVNKTHYPPCPKELYPTPECVHKCRKGYKTSFNQDKHRGKEPYSFDSVKDIQKDILENGPVSAGLFVFQDLVTYTSGVYRHREGGYLGGHAVKILGWGEEKGEKYWLIANSWNSDWGDKGFFKIARGEDECFIESMVIAGLPSKK